MNKHFDNLELSRHLQDHQKGLLVMIECSVKSYGKVNGYNIIKVHKTCFVTQKKGLWNM